MKNLEFKEIYFTKVIKTVEPRQNQSNSEITGLPIETVHVPDEDPFYTTASTPRYVKIVNLSFKIYLIFTIVVDSLKKSPAILIYN